MGFSCDTIRHIITPNRRGGQVALYYPENIIISREDYISDTIKIINIDKVDPILYYESLGDSTVKIDLGVIYLEPIK